MPRDIDRVLNALHIDAFTGKDMHGPIGLEHLVEPALDLNVSDLITAWEGPDFLHREVGACMERCRLTARHYFAATQDSVGCGWRRIQLEPI